MKNLIAILLLSASLWGQGIGGSAGMGGKAGIGGGFTASWTTGCSNTANGAFTCVSTNSAGGTFCGSTTTCAQTLSVTSGNMVLGLATNDAAAGTMSVAGSGSCGNTVTNGTAQNISAFQAVAYRTTASSTGTCTLTLTAGTSGTLRVMIWQFRSGSNTYDAYGDLVNTGFVGSGTPMNCPSVTTTVNGDMVLCMSLESGGGNGVITPTAPLNVVTTGVGGMATQMLGEIQATLGAITPAYKSADSQNFGVTTFSLKP